MLFARASLIVTVCFQPSGGGFTHVFVLFVGLFNGYLLYFGLIQYFCLTLGFIQLRCDSLWRWLILLAISLTRDWLVSKILSTEVIFR